MKNSEIFKSLLENLKVGQTATKVAARRDEITKALNKEFRQKEGLTSHRLMVGSFGRHTAIRGVSDLDLIFILPPDLQTSYKDENGPRRILNKVRDALQSRYTNTDIQVDRCVVRVQFTTNKFKFEVQPAFENEDGSFDYPDTVTESWRVTKPRQEIEATQQCNLRTSNNMRHLSRMVRAWKNTNNVAMGGLLIDTLVHNFFLSTSEYDQVGTSRFDSMVRDFFEFLKDEPEQTYYLALGSRQRVSVKKPFQYKAKQAYGRCVEAIEEAGSADALKKWREVFGASVPAQLSSAAVDKSFDDTEQFIEDFCPVDIRESVTIDCEVTQNGWRPTFLRRMLRSGHPLLPNKKLEFMVTECSASQPYELWWKVLNRGYEAERRNCIRGQIIQTKNSRSHFENTHFRGEHIVECYVVREGVVVARDVLNVPIESTIAR